MADKTKYYGTTVQQFVDMDWSVINNMTKSQLRDFAQKARYAANKRVKNMYKELGDYSPGIQNFLDAGGGKFTKDMNVGQMRTQVANLRELLTPPDTDERLSTKSLGEYKRYLRYYSKKLKDVDFTVGDQKVKYDELSEDARKDMWHFIDSGRSVGNYGRSQEQGSDAYIKTLAEKWVSLGQPHVEAGENITKTRVSGEEITEMVNQAKAIHARSITSVQQKHGVSENFNSFGG